MLLKHKESETIQRTQFGLKIPNRATIIEAFGHIVKRLQLDADFVAIERCEEFVEEFEVNL